MFDWNVFIGLFPLVFPGVFVFILLPLSIVALVVIAFEIKTSSNRVAYVTVERQEE